MPAALPDRPEGAPSDLRALIDPFEDQVRIYPTTSQTFAQRYIIGTCTVEQRIIR